LELTAPYTQNTLVSSLQKFGVHLANDTSIKVLLERGYAIIVASKSEAELIEALVKFAERRVRFHPGFNTK
jgi:hypothetical protein